MTDIGMATHPKEMSATPRLDRIEETQQAMHEMLSHLVNGRQTSEESDPFIHVVAGDEKWNICLNRAGKWMAGIVAVLVPTTIVAAFSFAYSGARTMGEVSQQLDNIEHRLDRLGSYIERVDDRVNGKVDKP